MSRIIVKLFEESDIHPNENSDADSKAEENIDELMNALMSQQWDKEITEENAETSEDFLELARSATSKTAILKYAKKAVELDPDNIDASVMIIELTAASFEKMLEKYKELIDKGEERLKADGYFREDNIGEFWLLLETRPYMRLLVKYADSLVHCGRMRPAIAVYEKMIKLCENDNLGARYPLMHLYTFFEDERSALELLGKYPDDDTQFLLPLSMLYYKLGNLREANKYLKKLCEINKDTGKFFNSMVKGSLDKLMRGLSPLGYRPFTIDEFLVEFRKNPALFATAPLYFEWAWKKINSKK